MNACSLLAPQIGKDVVVVSDGAVIKHKGDEQQSKCAGQKNCAPLIPVQAVSTPLLHRLIIAARTPVIETATETFESRWQVAVPTKDDAL